MEVYRHGASFINPRPEAIPYQNSGPEFITYGTPATEGKGKFGTRRPYWAATTRRFHPRGGFEMIKNTPAVDGLGAWFSDIFGRREMPRTRIATNTRAAGPTAMATRKSMMMNARPRNAANHGFMSRMRMKRTAERNMGLSGISDMPTYGELALGQAQAPTGESGSTVRGGVTGFLQSLLTTGAGIYQTQQATKLMQLKAQVQAGEAAMMAAVTKSPVSMPMILGIGGAALLAATLLLKKKKG